jgi:uncharacterized phage-associated protein
MKDTTRADEKLRGLILHICIRSEDDEAFGAVKLNKLLFFSDFLAFVRLGKAITGQEYQKLDHGPAPRRMLPVIREMERSGVIRQRSNDFYGMEQTRTIALEKPDLSKFTAEEIALVDTVVAHFRRKTAQQVSDESHQFLGWEVAGPGETIPYEVALIGTREPTERDRKMAKELAPVARERLSRNAA